MSMSEQLELVSATKSFDGWVKRYKHYSRALDCDMIFAIYLPPQAEAGAVDPVARIGELVELWMGTEDGHSCLHTLEQCKGVSKAWRTAATRPRSSCCIISSTVPARTTTSVLQRCLSTVPSRLLRELRLHGLRGLGGSATFGNELLVDDVPEDFDGPGVAGL